MVCEDLSPEMGGQAISIPLLENTLKKLVLLFVIFQVLIIEIGLKHKMMIGTFILDISIKN